MPVDQRISIRVDEEMYRKIIEDANDKYAGSKTIVVTKALEYYFNHNLDPEDKMNEFDQELDEIKKDILEIKAMIRGLLVDS